MGWYIPFQKFEKLDDELDKWDYFVAEISKIRWILGIYSLSVIFWTCWVFLHPNTYKTIVSKVSCIFIGGIAGLMFGLVAIPFFLVAGLILAWILTNVCAILLKLFAYLLR